MKKDMDQLRQTNLRIANSLSDLFEIELFREHQVKMPKASVRIITLGTLTFGFNALVRSEHHKH